MINKLVDYVIPIGGNLLSRNSLAGAGIAGVVITVSLLVLLVWRARRDAQFASERSRELERLSGELLRANRMKSEFLANVSHEFRTPLNAIVGFVELLRDGVYGDLPVRQLQPVDRIANSAVHLRMLVDQVLDIAKMAAGRMEVHPERIDLRPFVLEVASEIEPLAQERGLTLSISVGSMLPSIQTDPTHFRQILVNLLGNAVKFTVAGGIGIRVRSVNVATSDPQQVMSQSDQRLGMRAPDAKRPWLALQVSDTGRGISPMDQVKIFEEFQQIPVVNPVSVNDRGSGLGLAISRRLAHLLGGDLVVDSELGKGSTFTLWLPVQPAR